MIGFMYDDDWHLDPLDKKLHDLRAQGITNERLLEHIGKRIDHLVDGQHSLSARVDKHTDLIAGARQDIKDIDGRLDTMDGRLDTMDGRLDGIDGRLDTMDGRLDGIDSRLDTMNGRLDEHDRRFDKVDERFDKVDGKLDQVLELLKPSDQ